MKSYIKSVFDPTAPYVNAVGKLSDAGGQVCVGELRDASRDASEPNDIILPVCVGIFKSTFCVMKIAVHGDWRNVLEEDYRQVEKVRNTLNKLYASAYLVKEVDVQLMFAGSIVTIHSYPVVLKHEANRKDGGKRFRDELRSILDGPSVMALKSEIMDVGRPVLLWYGNDMFYPCSDCVYSYCEP